MTTDSQSLANASEKNFRPTKLVDFIGQSRSKETLRVMLESARIRNVPVDHLNLTGGPGLGKTTIAAIVATEMGAQLRELSAPSIERLGDLVSVLISLQDRDVLFLDEIHRLRSEVAETLYSAMEDFKVSIPVKGGQAEGASPITLPLKRFTLIGATTDYGLMPEPLRARFGHTFTLDLYTVEELVKIILRAAGKSDILIAEDAAEMMAKRSRGTPRVALRLFRRCMDLLTVRGEDILGEEIVGDSMAMLHLDDLGLGADDLRYLEVLAVVYGGGPTGPKALAASTGFDEARVIHAVEPWLLNIGLVARTPRGRRLTRKGWQHVASFIKGLSIPKLDATVSNDDDEGSDIEEP